MVRDWCKYRLEEEEQEDLVTSLLLHNLDHCVDQIMGEIKQKETLTPVHPGHLDTFSLCSVASVCTTWRQHLLPLLSPSATARAWGAPLPSPSTLRCRWPITWHHLGPGTRCSASPSRPLSWPVDSITERSL